MAYKDKEKERAYHRQYYKEHGGKDKSRERAKRYREKNRKKINKKAHERYHKDPEKSREYYRNWGSKNTTSRNEYSYKWRRKHPEKVALMRRKSAMKKNRWWIELLGGKCIICGYDKGTYALQSHHLDGTIKHEKLKVRACAMQNLSYKTLKEEAEKVVLLCANCHAEVHEGITKIPSKYRRKKKGGIKSVIRKKETGKRDRVAGRTKKPTSTKVHR